MDFRLIDELTRKLSASLPPGLHDMRQELEQQFRNVLQTTLQKMDLVTREEFDVQKSVLLKTREKLEALEEQLKKLQSE